MTGISKFLRKRQGYGSKDLDELSRDVDNAFGTLVPVALRDEIEDVYFEPMTLGNLEREPAMIFAGRVRESANPENPLAHGVRVNFTWLGNGVARIDDIDGLTPGTKYKFRFLVVG